jgi:hypothetical protein
MTISLKPLIKKIEKMYNEGSSIAGIIEVVQKYIYREATIEKAPLPHYDRELGYDAYLEKLKSKGWLYLPRLKLLFVTSKISAELKQYFTFDLTEIEILDSDLNSDDSDIDYVLWRVV